MTVNDNGNRYAAYRLWNDELHRPYDYAHKGLLKRLVSNRVADTPNTVTRSMLAFIDKSLVYVLKYIDVLENFFNYNWRNR